jgi:hypothetical protein
MLKFLKRFLFGGTRRMSQNMQNQRMEQAALAWNPEWYHKGRMN